MHQKKRNAQRAGGANAPSRKGIGALHHGQSGRKGGAVSSRPDLAVWKCFIWTSRACAGSALALGTACTKHQPVQRRFRRFRSAASGRCAARARAHEWAECP